MRKLFIASCFALVASCMASIWHSDLPTHPRFLRRPIGPIPLPSGRRLCQKFFQRLPYATWRNLCSRQQTQPPVVTTTHRPSQRPEHAENYGTTTRCNITYEGKCFRFVLRPTEVSDVGVDEGEKMCGDVHGKLANIYSLRLYNLIESLLRDSVLKSRAWISAWLGMTIKPSTGRVYLSDGKRAPNLPWYGGYPVRDRVFTFMTFNFNTDASLSENGMVNAPPGGKRHGSVCEI